MGKDKGNNNILLWIENNIFKLNHLSFMSINLLEIFKEEHKNYHTII